MENQHFTIVGAGIGGLTMGLILKQKGYQADIFESTSEIKPVGAGIVMANNAMQIFRKMGIQQKVEAAGNKISKMKITDERLKVISTIDLSKYESKYSVRNVAIHRADLQKILADETGAENIHLSKRLSAIEKMGQYSLSFEDGTTAHTDIIIGADGIKSTVRNQLFAPGTIRDTGQICWRGVCEKDISEQYQQEAYEAWGKGKRVGFVKINQLQTYWYAVANTSLVKEKSLNELFSEFHPDILSILENTPQNAVHQSYITDLKPIYKWQNDNVCLIGDAAHATTPNMGQGACQAIEDAYVIGELLGSGKSVNDSFSQYEKLRIKKAHGIVSNSMILGKVSHFEHPLAVKFRNFIMKNTPESANYKQLDKVFDINYF